jgi:hypothetical protein
VDLLDGWRLQAERVVERGCNALYRGRADVTFEDVTEAAGYYDNDGDSDSRSGSWITVICESPGGANPPIRTTVTVSAGGIRQWRDIEAGERLPVRSAGGFRAEAVGGADAPPRA